LRAGRGRRVDRDDEAPQLIGNPDRHRLDRLALPQRIVAILDEFAVRSCRPSRVPP